MSSNFEHGLCGVAVCFVVLCSWLLLKPTPNFISINQFHTPKKALSFSLSLMALCSQKFLLFLFLFSAVPIGIIVTLERAHPATHVYHYHSSGWFRECSKWDSHNRRFIVSRFEGGLGQVKLPEKDSDSSPPLEEVTVVKEASLAGNASLGIVIDPSRNRVLVVNADAIGNRYGALAAYDLSTWNRLFLTQLSGPSKLLSLHF